MLELCQALIFINFFNASNKAIIYLQLRSMTLMKEKNDTRRKLFSHQEAPFKLESYLPTAKLFSHQKAHFPLGSSLPQGSYLPTGKLNYHQEDPFLLYWEPYFPQGNFLPTRKLPSYCESLFPLENCLTTGVWGAQVNIMTYSAYSHISI